MMRDPDKLIQSLGALPPVAPPQNLRTSLQVLASRERQRRIRRRSLRTQLQYWKDRLELFFEESLRTIALPCAGGLSSSVALFVLCVVPAYPRLATITDDIPTVLTTQPEIKDLAPFGTTAGDIVVDVRVDGQGRMIDYTVVSGSSALTNPEQRHRLENALLFSAFTPATSFGMPTRSKMRLWFRSSHVDVRG